jgi:asparagine synthase (glutamine-hydrolysing)
MCGICGEWDPAGVEASTLHRISRTLAHRGPDDHGFALLGEMGLAMQWLSIEVPADQFVRRG